MFFIVLVEVPVLRRELQAFEFSRRMEQLGKRFQVIVWQALGILLLTGVVNLILSGAMTGRQDASGYHQILGLKVLIFLVLSINTALHGFFLGPQMAQLSERIEKGATELVDEHQRLRRRSMVSSSANLLLAVSLLFVGLWLGMVKGV